MKSHGACLMKMTLILTENFPKSPICYEQASATMSHNRPRHPNGKQEVCLPLVPAAPLFESRMERTELFKSTTEKITDRYAGSQSYAR